MWRAGLFAANTRWLLTVVLISTGLLLMSQPFLHAAELIQPGTRTPETIKLTSGKSIVMKTTEPIKRVSIGSPEIAGYVLLSPKEIYITGKSAGTTNMILWQNGDISGIYDIVVSYDISDLKERLHELLPDEKDLKIMATRNSITLSGRVSSASSQSQAVALAKSYAPKGKVNNLLEVGGIHQVMLEVRVAEMQRSLIRRLGVNFSHFDSNEFEVSMLGGLSKVTTEDLGLFTEYSPSVNYLFSFESGGSTWTGLIDLLKEEGLVKVLAEPTLIALSGQSASFLAGGEFPVPVPEEYGEVTIEFKKFGVSLAFTPTVIGPDKINLKVAPEVSELDFTTAFRFSGYVVPGLSTRRTSTVIELADGQSFAIAGLLRDTARDQYAKYPILGDIPILGALFKSRSFQKNETELVIIATPHLVKPIDGDKQPLPTDFYIEPSDTDFYLLGNMEGKPKENGAQPGKFDGDYGHVAPRDL